MIIILLLQLSIHSIWFIFSWSLLVFFFFGTCVNPMNYEIRPGRGLLSGYCCQFVNKQLHNKESANGPPKKRYSIHVALDTFPKNIYILHTMGCQNSSTVALASTHGPISTISSITPPSIALNCPTDFNPGLRLQQTSQYSVTVAIAILGCARIDRRSLCSRNPHAAWGNRASEISANL